MTQERYVELLRAGPSFGKDDWRWLRTFRPTLKPIVIFVALALRNFPRRKRPGGG